MTLDVQIESVSVQSTGLPLLRDLRLQVASGEIHTVMGPSGCGKSTLLAAICGSLAEGLTLYGHVSLDGQDITARPIQARNIGIVMQDDLLFPHMTVRENLLFAAPAGAKAQRETAVRDALVEVELEQFLNAAPHTLSGGQRSRISLARTLLAAPRALLLDEPFSKLDVALRGRMREMVFQLIARRGTPTLLVSHDVDDIADQTRVTRLSAPVQA